MSSSARKSSASKIKLDTYDDLFGNDTAENSSLEQIISVPLTDLHTFKDHPFRVVDDEKMEETTESIKKYGVLAMIVFAKRISLGWYLIARIKINDNIVVFLLDNKNSMCYYKNDNDVVFICSGG